MQAPPWHWFGVTQAAPLLCQVPVALQFCGCWTLHCVWPCPQDPPHADPTPDPMHVLFELVQVVGLPQVPEVVQLFCVVRLAHSV